MNIKINSLNITTENDELFEVELSEWQERAVKAILGLEIETKDNGFYVIKKFTDEQVSDIYFAIQSA